MQYVSMVKGYMMIVFFGFFFLFTRYDIAAVAVQSLFCLIVGFLYSGLMSINRLQCVRVTWINDSNNNENKIIKL